jgi:hypothetical protein
MDKIIVGVPKWVDCKDCANEKSGACVCCAVKFETAPYISFTPKEVIITKAGVE